MNCPDCNSESRVVKTIIGVGVRQRYRQCTECGTRWVSEERSLKVRWGEVTGNPPATMGNSPATRPQPPPTTGNPPPTVDNGWGVGGGLPSGQDLDLLSGSGSVSDLLSDPLSRSGSVSDRDPDPVVMLKLVAQESTTTKPRRAFQDEPGADFLAFWHIYPRKVAKARAWAAWKRTKPSLDDVLAALAWQVESAQWTRDGGEYVPYPASYLNDRRWQDQKSAPDTSGPRVGRVPSTATREAAARLLARHGDTR